MANTAESVRRSYALAQVAFVISLAILLCSELGGVLPGVVRFLAAEAAALLLFGLIVRAVS